MFALVLALVLVADVDPVSVFVAPDQPAAHVFTDEPLVIEFLSAENTTLSGRILIEGESEAYEHQFTALMLERGEPFWMSLPDAPTTVALYRLTCFRDGEEEAFATATFCRVVRPESVAPLPISVYVASAGAPMLDRLTSLTIDVLSLDYSSDADSAAVELAVANGFSVDLAIALGDEDHTLSTIEAAAKRFGRAVRLWAVDGAGPANRFVRVAQAIHRGAPRARMAALVSSADELAQLLDAGAGPFFNVASLPQGSDAELLKALRDTAERRGYEGLRFTVTGEPIDESVRPDSSIATSILRSISQGYDRIAVDAAQVYGEEGFRLGYPELSGLSRWLGSTRYVGPLEIAASQTAEVFRLPGENNWVVALWPREDEALVELEIGDATDLELRDACDNLVPGILHEGTKVTVPVGGSTRLVRGRGGSVLARAARTAIRNDAAPFLKQSDLLAALTPEVADALRILADSKATGSTRGEMFTLIRAMPEFERAWHEGALRRSLAVPILARSARIVRNIAVLEQQSGTPFLEPLDQSLAKCGEFQSLYLTGPGSVRGSLERGDWLLTEVGRLMDEARALLAEGRSIEAGSVAAIAEWRARSLAYSQKPIPLSEPEPPAEPATRKPATK